MLDKQTISDLEFDVIRTMLSEGCYSDTARSRFLDLVPLKKHDDATKSLDEVSELLTIREEGSGFVRLEFEELNTEIKRLGIHGSVLELEGFIHLLDASRLVNELIKFFQTRPEAPMLTSLVNQAFYTEDIIAPIEQVLDRRMKVKDDASSDLLAIRQNINRTRKEVNRNFDKVIRKLAKAGYLADTTETYINDRRVLSVLSSYKREVAGNVVGASKTGNFTYIEPRENMMLNNELEMLLDDERSEVRRIFKELTNAMRNHLPLIESYQSVLTEFDFINAKVRLAMRMDAKRPALEEAPMLELISAYHPLLLLSNLEAGRDTIPQSLYMDKYCRMMVISGPNAGGKSITLKTVGLLQIMVQSGLLVPCDPSSKFGWFQLLLSDIGDNQSIANQLSTYSYRLKRMKQFLERANKRTLLLLDEFGTGSDPELGGALAEVFFEHLYNKKSFGVITTHYANIKLKASRLKNAVNASMLFDRQSLEPKYQLSVGQPGSSFTFEVAQINGIPQDIIEEAKNRLDTNKVELDTLISALQKEKSEIEEMNRASKSAESEAQERKEESEALIEHYESRLIKQQKLIETNNKELSNGKKMSQFINSYRLKGQNKKLLEEVRKFLAIEKSKIIKKAQQTKHKQPIQPPKPSKLKLKQKKKEKDVSTKPVTVGAKVRLVSGTQHGEVVELNNQEAVVIFGNFKTKTKVKDLEVI